MKNILKKIIIYLKSFVISHPGLKNILIKILNYFPEFKAILKKAGHTGNVLVMNHINGPEHLSPQAKKIYSDLKEAIEQNKKSVK